MKISQDIIAKIRNNKKLRCNLMYTLGIGERTLLRELSENRPYGRLTVYAVLQLIVKELNLSHINDILVD